LGVDGLLDEQRPGRPPTLDEKAINRVLTLTTQYVCVFHAIRPPKPRSSGQWFHDHPAT